MSILIVLWSGLFLAAFFFLLLAAKGRKITSDWFLMAWLVASGVHLGFYIHNLFYYSPAYEWLYRAGFSLSLVHAPLLFLYVCVSTGVNQWYCKKYYLHFIPYLAFSAAVATLLTSEPIGRIRFGYLIWHSDPGVVLRYYGLVLAVSGIGYPAASYVILRHYQRKVLPGFFSSEARVNLNWLKYWVLASIVYSGVVVVLVMLAVDAGLLDTRSIFQWVAVLLVVHLVYIGFFGLRQTAVFTDYPEVTEVKRRKEKPPHPDQHSAAHQLTELMRRKKPYLAPDLSLPMLAEQAGMSVHELSALINDHFGKNFHRFVNEYRVEEFKRQVVREENTHLKILAVAFQCGFNSKSTFNKVFSEVAGMSPSEFRNRMGKQ